MRTPPRLPPTLELFIEYNKLELAVSSPIQAKFQNLTKAEKEAPGNCRGRRDIIIKPANKGLAVVIMNTADYLAEGY